MHLDILLSLRAVVDPTFPDENIDQSDSDYESDLMMEIADCHGACHDLDDIQHESDLEDVSQPPDRGCLSS